jgi:pimeloyl-ACP methyl ester carboxylesterase
MTLAQNVEFESAGLRLRGERWAPEGGAPEGGTFEGGTFEGGARGTVLLLHGGGQTRGSWKDTARRLADRGWAAVALDMRGHGDSDWAPDGSYSISELAEDVLAVCDQIEKPGGHPPVLVGASAGGIGTILAAAQQPDAVRALVLVDIAPRIEPSGANRIIDFMAAHTGGFDSLEDVHQVLVDYNPERSRPFDAAALQRNVRRRQDGRWYWHWDPAVVTSFGGTFGDDLAYDRLSAAARTIAVPTLLVRGRQSDVLSEEGARELLELIPHARFVDVSAGHMVAGDDNDVFTAEVDGFLESVVELEERRG